MVTMDAAVVRKVICAMHSVSPPYSMLSSVPSYYAYGTD